MAGPLAGLRVIDLTQMLAGPYATMVLADLGADVVKVEPLAGDGVRQQGPFLPDDDLHDFGGYFQSVNRNKRSVALDLKAPEGREVLLRLIDGADVLVENYRVGVMDRLGLGYEALHERCPRLVYAAVRGFGDPRTGVSPYVDWPAYDVVAQAMGGLMGITGVDAGHPLKVGPGVGDVFPAVLTVVGVLAALRSAEQTGEGQFVDVAMYDGVLALCERIVYQHSYTGAVPGPEGNGHPLLCPFDVFPTADGWMTIAAPRDHLWRLLCDGIGRPELGTDERYATNAARVAHCEEVRAAVSSWTSARTNGEVLATLGGLVPCGPVNTVADIVADPHVKARQMIVELEHPGSPTPVSVVGTPIKLTGTPPGAHRRAPRLGEHTDDVLLELGYSADEVTRLLTAGAIRSSG
ncbi:MAG: CoA-transferase [Mycobacterium sp.]|jgi:crotonobetainyl-CoA:carnitine CoA-transferase CaiB-like acyl-CoA transferase|nr:CoA-transferase [Mycobacterium sp.]